MVGVADTNLVWIPPGTFLMGSPTNEEGRITVASTSLGAEGPQTLVTLTTGFLMGRFEVSCTDWLEVTAETKSTNLQSAVTDITWSLATNYCALKTSADLSSGKIPPGWSYRLPTEAEWEYACRAGTTNPFSIGVGTELRNDDIRKDANIDGTTPYPASVIPVNPLLHVSALRVGAYAPNAFGLYDVHGNVEEWCWDNISGAANNGIGGLPGGSVTNPIGTVGGFRSVYRGGGPTAVDARAAARKFSLAIGQFSERGFRVVLVPPN